VLIVLLVLLFLTEPLDKLEADLKLGMRGATIEPCYRIKGGPTT
jgi:hypothetical protein